MNAIHARSQPLKHRRRQRTDPAENNACKDPCRRWIKAACFVKPAPLMLSTYAVPLLCTGREMFVAEPVAGRIPRCLGLCVFEGKGH